MTNFLETYSEQLHSKRRAIVFGDFNLDLLKPDGPTREYKDILKENNFKILNKIDKKHCTRETATTKTILDHICSNLRDHNCHITMVDSDMSDHKQMFLEIENYRSPSIKKVEYQALNYTALQKCFEDVDNIVVDSYKSLEQKILASITKSTITKTKTLNPPQQDWIKQEIIQDINERNLLWQKLKLNQTDVTLQKEYEEIKATVAKKIQKTKNSYYLKSISDNMTKPRKMWKLINDLSKNKIRDDSGPDKLEADSCVYTDKTEICEQFNSYFSNIGSSLAGMIPDSYKRNQSHQDSGISNMLELKTMQPTTTDEIDKIIDNLDANTGAGIDGITTKSILCIKKNLVPLLTTCINKCLEQGSFPSNLKIAKVVPIYKSGTKSDPSNYRPISVLPVLSKIFEKVIYTRLEVFLKSIKFLYPKQYGFRPRSNTLSATIDLITKLKNRIDQKQLALGVFIDLKKAFDTISPAILLRKLSTIGIKDKALEIFTSYLENRKQVVRIGKYQSTPNTISYGVPQGSILGPLLFLIYINNISQIGLKGDISLYANDTTIFYFGHSIDAMLPIIQSDLNVLNNWFQSNLLTINIAKTSYVIFAPKNKKINDNIQLKINDKLIQRKSNEKYLGIILDNHLSWKPHIEKITSKLTSQVGVLHHLAKCLPRKAQYIIYNSLVKPHIDYLIEIWGTAVKSNLQKLQTKQNKLIKILLNYKLRTPTEKIYEDTKIMNVAQTHTYYTCILIHKILKKEIHTSLTFTKKTQVQKIKLRNANCLVTRAPRTNYGKKNIEYEGIQIYNKLPADVKDAKTILSFKKRLKKHLQGK
ncbi:hypothetical protein O3G_MSEX002874 [Manduca sexta]|uniref:Reverse transcriptase domain-containing protein n=1 Tax=Manduca sexta TaxID=7130 RepID=A0A921YR68_MANSE|nr:hypothetical protein O3G_MSEX002874 [Manduca sexta]